jgi:hypothetical protein
MATGIANKLPVEKQERRAASRYDVLLPVIVRFPGHRCCSARSRDISTGGAYLFIESDYLYPDTNVELTLTLPNELTGRAGVLMRALGKVIRVERFSDDETQRMGVAVVFETYDFIPSTSPSC